MSLVIGEGTHTFEGATIEISKTGDGFSIERIEVPEESRKKGIMRKVIFAIADQAKEKGLNVSAYVLPDEDNRALELKMIDALRKAGFRSLEMDGAIYPQELHIDGKA